MRGRERRCPGLAPRHQRLYSVDSPTRHAQSVDHGSRGDLHALPCGRGISSGGRRVCRASPPILLEESPWSCRLLAGLPFSEVPKFGHGQKTLYVGEAGQPLQHMGIFVEREAGFVGDRDHGGTAQIGKRRPV